MNKEQQILEYLKIVNAKLDILLEKDKTVGAIGYTTRCTLQGGTIPNKVCKK